MAVIGEENSLALNLLPGLAQRDGEFHLLLAAVDGHFYSVAGTMGVHDLREVLLVLDVLPVDGDDEVAAQHDRDVAEVSAFVPAAQSGAISGTAGQNLHDEQSEVDGQAHLFG